jgi:hypothetical protein
MPAPRSGRLDRVIDFICHNKLLLSDEFVEVQIGAAKLPAQISKVWAGRKFIDIDPSVSADASCVAARWIHYRGARYLNVL